MSDVCCVETGEKREERREESGSVVNYFLTALWLSGRERGGNLTIIIIFKDYANQLQ